MDANALLDIAAPVAAALADDRPVVALESTIITHGMPWPQNAETARAVEQDIRTAGAEPATLAVMDGRIRIGLDADGLDRLAQAHDVAKLSRADFAHALVSKRMGSTTVAATMIAAHLAGIAVFATGGIGGVHRGAGTSFDISADLDELARTPVTVVAAGAKAILDLPKTLEALETRGIPVIGYRTDRLPAFWSRDSGLPVPLRADSPAEIAAQHRLRQTLGLAGGQLVCNPVPVEAEIPAAEIAPAIAEALAETAGETGKDVTPRLLAAVLAATDGRSLATNIALVRNNARLAAEIAVALTRA